MSVSVLAPTPALPPVRRISIWDKIFGNFKTGKLEPRDIPRTPNRSSSRESNARLISTSTGIDTANLAKKRNASVGIKDTRSASAPMPSQSRASSVSSSKSRRLSRSRRLSLWRSANPEIDEGVPALPITPNSILQERKYSLFGSHNPDNEVEGFPLASPTSASRRASYVPRNAASSFMRTTTPLSSEEKAEVIRKTSVANLRSTSVASPPLPKKTRPMSMAASTPLSAPKRRSMSVIAIPVLLTPVADAPPLPVKAVHRPQPLSFNSTNKDPADHGMHSMAGICEIQDTSFGFSRQSTLVLPSPTPLSPGSLSPGALVRSPFFTAPLSPADTVMDSQVDSAKNSPQLSAVKTPSEVTVVELTV